MLSWALLPLAPGLPFSFDSDAFIPDDSEPFFPWDSAPFIPVDAPESFFGAAEGAPCSDEGALCWVVAPPGAPSRLPVPCAFAKPVPAIRAATAAEIKKRLVMEFLLTCVHCPRRQREEIGDVPVFSGFRRLCFVNA